MVRAKTASFVTIAALILAGCGGGGGGSTTPHAAAPASSPAAVSHTVVGTGKITLSLPKVLTATRNGKAVAVRAIPNGARRAQPRGTARTPLFVDPSPNPNVPGPCGNGDNLLDIYINAGATLQLAANLDGQAGSNDSWCVQATGDSTQTLNVPLYSTTSSQVVAIEFDATHSYILSIGESDNGGFGAGSTVTLNTLTMQMAAAGIGITDLAFEFPVPMFGGGYNPDSDYFCSSSYQFGVYTLDALDDFVPVAGVGGISTPTASAPPNVGTVVAQTAIPGVYNVSFDSSCDSSSLSASASNPAYAIYNDANLAYFGEGGGAYPGIDNLYDINLNNVQGYISSQLSNPTVSGSITLDSTGG